MLTPGGRSRTSAIHLVSLASIVVLLLAGIGASFFVFTKVDQSGRAHILERTATIAVTVSPEVLRELSGTEADLGTPQYESLKALLEQMRSVNHDARFIYVIGKQADEQLFFYADSEPALSEDYSPPGQLYYEASTGMYEIFADAEARTEGPDRDRWGVWISGYTPIVDETGNVVAMLGMDLPATRYLTDLFIYSLLPFLVSVLLVLVVVALEGLRRRELSYLEQKAEFLSIASHEIRTPLTGIRWAIEGLLKRENPPIDPKTRTILALVHESCLGLLSRVNNLLDLTALEGAQTASVREERLEARAFLEDIVDSLLLSARQREVSLHIDDSVGSEVSFVADRQMMHHAFFNLLTNAIKYTREGTAVRIAYEHADGLHRFRISDQGEGIPPEEQEKIFSGYHRTKDAVKSGQYGSGLGLYLVRKALELHGGSIQVSSAKGQGSTFTLTIPERELKG